MMIRHTLISLSFLALCATSTQADLVWTGGGDNISLYQEANWQDNGGGTPAAGTIDPDISVTAATGGLIRIDSGAGTPSNYGGVAFQIGPGNDLLVGGGKQLGSAASGLRVDATDSNSGPQQALTITGAGTLVRVQFLLELAATLADGGTLRLNGGVNPVNESTINFTSTDSILQFNDETLSAFQSEHLSKVSFNSNPLIFGSDPLVAEPGDNAIASAFNGATGVQINVFNAVPEPATAGLILFGLSGLLLRLRRG